MDYQRTINRTIERLGTDLYGGEEVRIAMHRADPDTGVIFRTQWGDIDANLDNAYFRRWSILLDNRKGARVLNVEHLLGTLFFYGIDNVIIETERTSEKFRKKQKRLFRLTTRTEVIPEFPKMQKTICNDIDEAGIKEQDKHVRIFTLDREYDTQDFEGDVKHYMQFKPNGRNNVRIKVHTSYKPIGDQNREINRDPEEYRGIANARRYLKHFSSKEAISKKGFIKYLLAKSPELVMRACASVGNFGFGFGHGFTKENVFVPAETRREWENQEIIPAEIAAHGVIDRAGAMFLLEQSLEGRIKGIDVVSYFSGHKTDLEFMKNIRDKFIEVN